MSCGFSRLRMTATGTLPTGRQSGFTAARGLIKDDWSETTNVNRLTDHPRGPQPS